MCDIVLLAVWILISSCFLANVSHEDHRKWTIAYMALEAHLAQAVLLKKVVDAIKGLVKEVNFDCNEKGIQVQSRDSSHVALVSLLPRESAFSSSSASGRYRWA